MCPISWRDPQSLITFSSLFLFLKTVGFVPRRGWVFHIPGGNPSTLEVDMITCSWCGTNYTAFQPNCDNCGGSLPLPPEVVPAASGVTLVAPPPPPRDVPRQAVWHILSSDGWAISGLVFSLLGLVFVVVGVPLTVSVVAAFVGLPFGVQRPPRQ